MYLASRKCDVMVVHNTPLVVQTNITGANLSFIKKIQIDMKIAIENAKHISFAGYSLPDDDFIYRSILADQRNRGKNSVKCSVVGYSENQKTNRCMIKKCILMR